MKRQLLLPFIVALFAISCNKELRNDLILWYDNINMTKGSEIDGCIIYMYRL